MTLRHSLLVLCVVVFSLGMTECRRHEAGEGGGKLLVPVPVAVSVNGNGDCQQNGAVQQITIDHNGGQVQWTAPNFQTACSISFLNTAAGCPFYVAAADQCSNYTCTNGTVTSAHVAPGHNSGEYFTYQSISINGTPCTVGGNGIKLDH